MAIDNELLDRLLTDFEYTKPEDLIGETGLLKQLTKGLLEREGTHGVTSCVNDAFLTALIHYLKNYAEAKDRDLHKRFLHQIQNTLQSDQAL